MLKYFQIVFIGHMLLACIVQDCKSEDNSPLLFKSDPPGPTYPTATWIKFACKADNHTNPETLRYEWRGYCNRTGETILQLVVDDPLLDEDRWAFIWLMSTSTDCVDYVECKVIEGSDQVQTVGEFISVEGVGAYIQEVFLGEVKNNTAISITEDARIWTLVCQSALSTSCDEGVWLNPDNVAVSENGLDTESESCSSVSTTETTYANTQLSLSPTSIHHNTSGLYTCLIQDEDEVTRVLYIGIYSDQQEREDAFRSSLRLTHLIEVNRLTLSCITTQLPTTSTVWGKDRSTLQPATKYVTHTSLVNQSQSMYTSQLAFDWNDNKVSVFQCDVYSEWVLPSESNYGGIHANGNFVVLELNKAADIECETPVGIFSIQWLDKDRQTINTSQYQQLSIVNNNLRINNVKESLHNQTFQCMGEDDIGNVQLRQFYHVIVSVPPDTLVVTLIGNHSKPIMEGNRYNITCCYSYNPTGLVSTPSIEWYDDDVKSADFSVTTDGQCSTLNLLNISKEHNGRTYTCRGVLDPLLLQNGNLTHQVVLNVIEDSGGPSAAVKMSPLKFAILFFVMSCLVLIGQ